MGLNEQSSDEELLRKEINRITAILRDLRKSGIKLNESNLKAIQGMAKSADQWGKALTLEKGKNQRLEETARRMKDNHAWLDKHTESIRKNRAVQQANSLEKQREHQQDVQTNIKYRSLQAKSGEQMAFFTKALHGGVGIGTIFEKMGGSVYRLSKQFEVLDEVIRQTAEIEQLKAQNLDPAGAEKLGALERARKSNVNALGGEDKVADMQNDNTKNKFGKSLGAMGKFAKKHATGIALGVGAGGLILSTIIKALSVAPMFQAMMKLFKFAVTMILMPIGTFFGAILRPIMIGLIKTIAPQFKGWMKTAMKLGDQVGKFIMDFFTDPAKYLVGAMGGIIPMIVSAFSFPDWNSWNPFDDGKTEKEKDQEHKNYWDGVNEDFQAVWNSIYKPIEEFGALVTKFFITDIPNTFSDVWESVSSGLSVIGKTLLNPLLTFVGTINTIFLWYIPSMLRSFWTYMSSAFSGLQNTFTTSFEVVEGFWIYITDAFTELKNAILDWITPLFEFFGISKPDKDMEDAAKSTKSVASFSDQISEWWRNISTNSDDSEDDSKDSAHAMEGISKIFDGAAKWINRNLRTISTYRYVTRDGGSRPTAAARTAMAINKQWDISSGGSIADWYKKAGNGFDGMVNSPTMFLAGEAGAEHVNISPHGNKSGGSGAVININIAKIERDADFNQLKPMIQRWILEANSRRGMI
jgi:hypothetical protein